jgi:tetratricopeptide (TPR) repeat protein
MTTDLLIPDCAARELAETLDGFPLALSIAGTYLYQDPIDLRDYVGRYRQARTRIEEEISEASCSEQERALYAVLDISKARIEETDPQSANIVNLWAYLDHQDLILDLFQPRSSIQDSPEWFKELAHDVDLNDRAMRVVCDYALVEHCDTEIIATHVMGFGYRMSESVHRWVRMRKSESDYAMMCLAVKMVELCARGFRQHPTHLLRLVQDANRCSFVVRATTNHSQYGLSYYNLNNWLARFFSDVGKPDETVALLRTALQGFEEELGPNHRLTLQTLHNLGQAHLGRGDLEAAEEVCQEAYRRKESVLEADDTSLLRSLKLISDVYEAFGSRFEEQGELEEAADRHRIRAEGPDSRSVHQTLFNLGGVYLQQGKSAEAASLYDQGLEGCQRTFGPSHRATLDRANEFGILLASLGRFSEAESHIRYAWDGKEEFLGFEDPSTIKTLRSVAEFYETLLDYADPGPVIDHNVAPKGLYEDLLDRYDDTLGASHPTTLYILYKLGRICARDADQFEEAERMLVKALERLEDTSGPDHEVALEVARSLGEF